MGLAGNFSSAVVDKTQMEELLQTILRNPGEIVVTQQNLGNLQAISFAALGNPEVSIEAIIIKNTILIAHHDTPSGLLDKTMLVTWAGSIAQDLGRQATPEVTLRAKLALCFAYDALYQSVHAIPGSASETTLPSTDLHVI